MARTPDPIDAQVGLTLRRLRHSKGVSQQQLGQALGTSFQQVQKYERGANRLSASMLVRAAMALDVQPADLLPKTDGAALPPVAWCLAVRGAEELLTAYAALPSGRLRRVVLDLVRGLKALGEASPG